MDRINCPNAAILFPGLTLEAFSGAPAAAQAPGVVTLCYCIAGHLGWQLAEGRHVYLGPGDFAVYTADAACQALPPQPDDIPQGMILRLDPAQFDAAPPPLLAGTGITGAGLTAKFGTGEAFLPLPGGSETAALFAGLAAGPGPLQAARQKLKALELLLYLSEMTPASQVPLTQYRAEQIAVIRQIHAQMIENMAQRFTIEALARQYLMNPTTLKEVFKSVYGTSIAAHIKAHRMQRAAELLQTTSLSLAEIAQAVGYSSQGKFTAAFKAYYQVPPKAFKKHPPDQSALPDCPCCK